MQKILFVVKDRPSKEKPGRTNVINRVNGDEATDTLIGKLRKPRGSDWLAFVLNGDGSRTQLDGTFATRSQAGHAVQRASQADVRTAKLVKREAATKAVADRKAAKAALKAAA